MLDSVISNEREKSLKNIANVSTAKRDPSHTFGMTRNENTSIVIPTERSDEESPKCTEKRDPSHTFGMTNMLDYVISNEREKSLKNIANK